jgi:phosphopantetheine adenylyltransferase
MATSQRIYLVTTNEGKKRLVKATQRQQALSHVANSLFTVRVASQDDLVEALTSGTEVENYKNPEQMELQP